ncbi:Fis family transcriptional regulator, partial [Mycobacterium kansasii]
AVGSSTQWQAVKTGYRQAVWEQQFTGAAGIPKVRAFKTRLASMQQSAGIGMTGYQTGGQTATSPPPSLPQPGLAPNG